MVGSHPSSGENTTLVPSQKPTHPPVSIPSGPLPPLPSARTQQDTDPGAPADDEMDVADISYILDMGIYWDEMPHTPGWSTENASVVRILISNPSPSGIDTRRLSEVAMLSPAIRDEVDDWRADPVLPSVFEADPASSPDTNVAPHVTPIPHQGVEDETVPAGS